MKNAARYDLVSLQSWLLQEKNDWCVKLPAHLRNKVRVWERERERRKDVYCSLPVVPAAPVNSPTWRKRIEGERESEERRGEEDCDMRGKQRGGESLQVWQRQRSRKGEALGYLGEIGGEEEDRRRDRRDEQARAQQQNRRLGVEGKQRSEWERERKDWVGVGERERERDR